MYFCFQQSLAAAAAVALQPPRMICYHPQKSHLPVYFENLYGIHAQYDAVGTRLRKFIII